MQTLAQRPLPRGSAGESVGYRAGTRADNAALLRLFAGCGMAARFSLSTLRGPDYFALSRLQGEQVVVGIAETQGAGVVGCVAVALRTVWLAGNPHRAACIHDLRVLPAYRRRGLGDGLLAWSRARAEEMVGPSGVAFAATLVGNRAIERRTQGPRGQPELQDVARMRVHTVLAAGVRNSSRPVLRVRPARAGEHAVLAHLWHRAAAGRELAPVLGPQQFADIMEGWPGLGADAFLVALERGEPVAFLGLWDQRGLKTIRVDRYPAPVGLIRAAYQLFRPIHQGASLPAQGEALAAPAVLHPCVPADRPDLLRALLGAAAARCSALRVPAFTIALDQRDPLSAALSGLPAVRTDFRVYLTSPVGRYAGPPLRPGHPVHFEHALV